MRCLATIFLAILVFPSQAATVTGIRTAVDTVVTNYLVALSNRQQNFAFNNGRYWQALSTHTATNTPRHTTAARVDTVPDNLNALPGGENERWTAVISSLSTNALPCALEINVYGGTGFRGWELVITFYFNGNKYRRVMNVGPESWRERAWYIEPEDP